MPLISSLSSKSGLKPSLIFLLFGFAIMLLAVFEILPDLLTTFFGMLYPAYMSYKVPTPSLRLSSAIWMSRRRFG
jgi:hypothetical protein